MINIENKLVSIIIPVFQAEQFIEHTINSVIMQSYPNFEIICVDDASKDNSYSLLKSLAKSDNRIKVFRNVDERGNIAKVNQGQEKTRNYGLSLASGDYFMFLDADDTLDSNTLETSVEIACYSNVDIVMFGYSEIRNDEEYVISSNIRDGQYTRDDFAKFLLNEISWTTLSCIGSKMYNINIYKNCGVRFNKVYKFNEDCAFILEALLASKSVYFVGQPFYKYLIRSDSSIMSSYREKMFVTNINVIELCRRLFIEAGCDCEKEQCISERVVSLILDSLANDEKFASKSEFINTIDTILNHKYFSLAKAFSKTLPAYNWRRLVVSNLEKYNFIYYVFRFRRVFKSDKKILKLRLILLDKLITKKYLSKSEGAKSEIYMFHHINAMATDAKNFISNIEDFEQLIALECKTRKPKALSQVCDCLEENAFYITFDDGYEDIYQYAYPILKKYKVPFAVFLITSKIGEAGYLNKTQIEVMLGSGLCLIGAHTCNHDMLRFSVDSYGEILESKRYLEKLLNIEISYFAYPYGSIWACSYKNIREVKKAGFDYAFSTISAPLNNTNMNYKWFLPRLNGDEVITSKKNEVKYNETSNRCNRV